MRRVLKTLLGSYLRHNFRCIIVAFPFKNEEGHLVLNHVRVGVRRTEIETYRGRNHEAIDALDERNIRKYPFRSFPVGNNWLCIT